MLLLRADIERLAGLMSISQWLLLILLSVLWGGSFFFVGVVVHEIPPLTLVLLRVGLAALTLWPVALVLRLPLPGSLAAWRPFAGMAVLNNIIPFSLITIGQSEIASGLASIINATTPLWAVLIAHLLTADEKLTPGRAIGVALGVAGVAILMGPAIIIGQPSSLIGMACVLAATISYGFSGLWGRRLRNTAPIVSATCQLTASTVMLLPAVLLFEGEWQAASLSSNAMMAVAGLAVLSTALAYIVFFHILSVSGPTNVMLVTLLIPVSAVVLGFVFLDERLLAQHIAGAGVIGSALIIFDGRLGAWLRGRMAKP